MAIIKSQYRVANGKDFNTIHHFETDSEQVLMSDGRTLEKVVYGEPVTNQNLSILKKEGKYLVTNCIGLPDGLTITETYLLKVFTVGETVWQTLYDHKGNNIYTRCMTNVGFSTWSNGGKDITDKVTSMSSDVNSLKSTVKTHGEKLDEHKKSIENIIKEMGEEVTAHNHDERYARITGGVFTGDVALANEVNLAGNATSGQSHSLIKINGSNKVVVGNNLTGTVIKSSGDIMIEDGTGIHKLAHSGNLEALNASTLDGNKASAFAKISANTFTGQQTVDGHGITLKGSSTGLRFTDYNNSNVANISASGSDLVMNVGNSEVLRLRSSDKALMTLNKFIVQGNGEFRFAMKYSASDDGVGFVASSGASDMVRFTDWGRGRTIWEVERSSNTVAFASAIKVGGYKVSVGASQPYNPRVGDIWIY